MPMMLRSWWYYHSGSFEDESTLSLEIHNIAIQCCHDPTMSCRGRTKKVDTRGCFCIPRRSRWWEGEVVDKKGRARTARRGGSAVDDRDDAEGDGADGDAGEDISTLVDGLEVFWRETEVFAADDDWRGYRPFCVMRGERWAGGPRGGVVADGDGAPWAARPEEDRVSNEVAARTTVEVVQEKEIVDGSTSCCSTTKTSTPSAKNGPLPPSPSQEGEKEAIPARRLSSCRSEACGLKQFPLHLSRSADDFREHVKQACASPTSQPAVIVSYSRKYFHQSGDGHFSPVGGYCAREDSVLILDTARFKYPPHWVPLEQLWEAMSFVDVESASQWDQRAPRGWIRCWIAGGEHGA